MRMTRNEYILSIQKPDKSIPKVKSGLSPIRMQGKPQRNKPCLCGSEKKYKFCCWNLVNNRTKV
jgi:uncharacterized protein YecA (UPF0149 family)